MAQLLLTTKFYFPPARTNLVPRLRLINRLEEGLRGPLTLIAAPAGYGKTTLLGEWHARGDPKIPVAWLSLDGSDNDPARFWFYLVSALDTLQLGLVDNTLPLFESHSLPPIESLLTVLINDLSGFPSQIVLALDDLHVITAPEIYRGLDFLIERLPPYIHLVLMTRADPPLALSRLRAGGLLTEIRTHDLHFTPDEASAFLNEVMGLRLSADEVAALAARTEGWIAGLQLAALSMQGREDVSAFIAAFTGSHHYILDYLVEEVLQQLSKPLQEFLLQTSILERFTGSLCEAVAGQDNGQVSLEYLEHGNLFLIPLDDDRGWYRYHNLFADMLRNRLKEMREIDIPALHHKASAWFESRQLAEEAITHAIAAQDLQRAALLVEQNALDMIRRGEIYALLRYIQKLPENAVQERPWLCAFVAWGRYHYGPRDETTRYVELAEKALQTASWITEGERKHITSFMAAIRAFKAIQDEDIPYALEMSHKAIALAPEWDFVSRISAVTLGDACWGRGDVMGAEQATHRSALIALKLGDPSHAISGAGYEAIHQIKQARLQDAYRTLNDALALAVLPDGRELPNAALIHIRLADLFREWNDLKSADQHIHKATRLLSQTGSPDYLVDGYVVLARIRLAQNDLPSARQALDMAQRFTLGTQIDPYVNTWLEEGWIRLWLAEGNFPAAVNWADHCGLTSEDTFSYLRDLEHINLARVWVAQGAQALTHPLPEALRLLDRLHQAAESVGWIHETIKVCTLQSLACQAANDSQGALSAISQALTLAEPAGYVRLFLDEGAPLVKQLHKASTQTATGFRNYAVRLLAAYDQGPAEPPAPQAQTFQRDMLVEPLSKREVEVLRLLADGCPNKEIAAQLVISVGTVKRHVVHILQKLDAANRTQAVAIARQLKII